MHICYAHLAFARFEHSVCRGSLMTTYIWIWMYMDVYGCVYICIWMYIDVYGQMYMDVDVYGPIYMDVYGPFYLDAAALSYFKMSE